MSTEQITGQPVLQIKVEQDADRPLWRVGQDGARPGRIARQQAAGRSGRRATAISAGGAVAREVARPAPRRSASMLVATPSGERIPLSRLASVEVVEGPSTITREWGQRRITVTANVRGRDLGSFVAEARQKIADDVALPAGPLPHRIRRAVREPAAGPHAAADRRAAGAGADLRAALSDLSQRGRRPAGVHRRAVRLGGRDFCPVAARHAVFDLGRHRLHRPVGRGRAGRHDPGFLRPATARSAACRSTRP